MINCCPICTGDSILYLDLSSDPDIFKGPKGDKQVRNAYLVVIVLSDWNYGSNYHIHI
jgi:serine/threonine-protein kinase haspin